MQNSVKAALLVWGKTHDITVYQESETVWVAVGEYSGEHIEVKAPSENSAAALWREAARYRNR